MGQKIDLHHALDTDPAPLEAPPAWRNSEVAVINDVTVLHAGRGRLDGRWHRQDSDEFLLVLDGELTVEFDAGPLTAKGGEGILIRKGERHRATVRAGCLLLSVEAVGMKRSEA